MLRTVLNGRADQLTSTWLMEMCFDKRMFEAGTISNRPATAWTCFWR